VLKTVTAPCVLRKFAFITLIILSGLTIISRASLSAEQDSETPVPYRVLILEIDGSINPAQEDVLTDALNYCTAENFDMLLIRLDTPGGLGSSMREMVQSILNAPRPVAVWVGPPGARAASAGVFIVAASTIASMAPQTSIGAAAPVGIGGAEVNGTMAEKIRNDIVSLVRGVAKSHGRNVDWYVKAVEESSSITATEALTLGVVEYVADGPEDLMRQAAEQGFSWRDEPVSLTGARFEFETYQPGFWYKILSWLLDPQVAYLLMLGGMAGLFFELASPGAVLPGVLGGICLLLGLYAMAILPTNVAGFLLIVFGLVLFVLEIKIISYGLLSLAAVVSLFIGSLILFRFDYGFGRMPYSTVIVTVGGVTLLIGLAVYLVAKAHRTRPMLGLQSMEGMTGEVKSWSDGQGTIMVRGELWTAITESGLDLQPGDSVRVTSARGLTLVVRPVSE